MHLLVKMVQASPHLLRLFQVYPASSGRIFVDGAEKSFTSTNSSEKAGIFTIHQEINLVPYFNAFENLFIGSEITKRGFLDKTPLLHSVGNWDSKNREEP